MSDKTDIEWTDSTWNPVTGCDKVSPGCDRCYAEAIADRFAGTRAFPNGFDVTLRPSILDQPIRWSRPRRIFVNSMSDLFHDQVPDDYIAHVWAVMAIAEHHTFQVLTKRHARMRSLLRNDAFQSQVARHVIARTETLPRQIAEQVRWWPLRNVWLGVSAENQKWADIRIPALLDTPAAARFVSLEPLLGEVMMRLAWLQNPTRTDPRLDWAIVGGESGRGARPMHPDWARTVRDQCQFTQTPFLFKQWGEYRPEDLAVDPLEQLEVLPLHPDRMSDPRLNPGPLARMRRVGKHAAGRVLDGRTWDEFPPAPNTALIAAPPRQEASR